MEEKLKFFINLKKKGYFKLADFEWTTDELSILACNNLDSCMNNRSFIFLFGPMIIGEQVVAEDLFQGIIDYIRFSGVDIIDDQIVDIVEDQLDD